MVSKFIAIIRHIIAELGKCVDIKNIYYFNIFLNKKYFKI
jgi:hypothetical protein